MKARGECRGCGGWLRGRGVLGQGVGGGPFLHHPAGQGLVGVEAVAALVGPAADPRVQAAGVGQSLVLVGAAGGEGVEAVPDGGGEGADVRPTRTGAVAGPSPTSPGTTRSPTKGPTPPTPLPSQPAASPGAGDTRSPTSVLRPSTSYTRRRPSGLAVRPTSSHSTSAALPERPPRPTAFAATGHSSHTSAPPLADYQFLQSALRRLARVEESGPFLDQTRRGEPAVGACSHIARFGSGTPNWTGEAGKQPTDDPSGCRAARRRGRALAGVPRAWRTPANDSLRAVEQQLRGSRSLSAHLAPCPLSWTALPPLGRRATRLAASRGNC